MRLSLKAIVPTAANKAGSMWWVEDNNPFCARDEKDEGQLPPAPKTSGDLHRLFSQHSVCVKKLVLKGCVWG